MIQFKYFSYTLYVFIQPLYNVQDLAQNHFFKRQKAGF